MAQPPEGTEHAPPLWLRPGALREAPAEAGPWGSTRAGRHDIVFEGAAGPGALEERLRADVDARVLFAWTPTGRHLRPVFEVPELREAVIARGRESSRRQLRAAVLPFLGVVIMVAAAIRYWPHQPQRQFLVLVLALVVGLPLWSRGVTRAWDAWRSRRALERDADAWRAGEARRLRFVAWAGSFRSLVAWGLGGAFVATFLVTTWSGLEPAVARFGLVKDAVRAGEAWRLVTCAFLHANFVHLFFNTSAGLALAGMARALVDESRILVAFAVAVVAASLASTFASPATVSIGASGGILGWGGLLLGLALVHPSLRQSGLAANILRWIVLLVVIGLAGATFIDNAAHAGGFLAGLALGAWWGRDRRPLPRWEPALPRAGWVAVLAVGGALWLRMIWLVIDARV